MNKRLAGEMPRRETFRNEANRNDRAVAKARIVIEKSRLERVELSSRGQQFNQKGRLGEGGVALHHIRAVRHQAPVCGGKPRDDEVGKNSAHSLSISI
jgi:hypothetical protein